MRSTLRLPLAMLALAGLVASAPAQQKTWCVSANGGEEVPPNNSTATADCIFTLDAAINELSWHISHSGLTGNHTATHLHGPASIGSNAGIQVDLGIGNPIVGSAFITPTQVAQLESGLWYVNLHTSAFGAGEIRGQVDDVCVETHCVGLANSFDPDGARLTTPGAFDAASNSITFLGTGVPPGKFAMLVIGQGTGIVNPPGSQGQLCLAGQPIGRFNTQILTSDGAGVLGPFTPDIINLPNPPGGSILAGDTWGFQAWFRDDGGVSNFTDALRVTFS